jgi:hypothetical protein
LTGDLGRMKDILQSEYVKIESLKEEIKTQNWRKTVG